MAKRKVMFKPKRIAEGEWVILAESQGVEVVVISGLSSKVDVDEWMTGNRRVQWLREQGYAK